MRYSNRHSLNLKAGEWIEVRSEDEILATLDERGCLENLPFMPEMFHYCGKKFRVFKRADKTCDNIGPWSIRRMTNAVHLEGVRCDGGGHDGCEAVCLIFWKESWLKRTDSRLVSVTDLRRTGSAPLRKNTSCTLDQVFNTSRTTNSTG